MRKASLWLIGLLVCLFVASGCKEERKIDVAARLNPSKMPTMTTKNVATFISDSGVVQYKVVAPIWKVFQEADTPYWDFRRACIFRSSTLIFMWSLRWLPTLPNSSLTGSYGVLTVMWR